MDGDKWLLLSEDEAEMIVLWRAQRKDDRVLKIKYTHEVAEENARRRVLRRETCPIHGDGYMKLYGTQVYRTCSACAVDHSAAWRRKIKRGIREGRVMRGERQD